MRPHLLRAAVLASCLLAALSAGRGPETIHAQQLLVNGDFETWAGGEPAAWRVGGTVTAVPATSGPGLAAGLAAGAQLRQ